MPKRKCDVFFDRPKGHTVTRRRGNTWYSEKVLLLMTTETKAIKENKEKDITNKTARCNMSAYTTPYHIILLYQGSALLVSLLYSHRLSFGDMDFEANWFAFVVTVWT